MNTVPHVVVAIPVYNGARYLASAVRSVLDQHYPRLSLYLLDDGSSDDPLHVLGEIPASAYHYVRNPQRLGMVGNHNRCLDFNTGDFFKILSQDDELVPGALLRQAVALVEKPQAVFVAGPREIIRPDGRHLLTVDHGLRGLVDRAAVCRALAWSGTNVVGEPASVLVRGDVLRRGARFPEEHPWLLDVFMWLKLLDHGPALMLDQPAARFRLSSQSYSVGLGRAQVGEFSRFIDDLARRGEIGPWRCRLGKTRCALNAVLRQWLYKYVGA